jgi:hypothetical protein
MALLQRVWPPALLPSLPHPISFELPSIPPSEDHNLGTFFLLCRVIPITFLVILGLFRCPSVPAFFITLPLNFLDFYITKTHFGPKLVGLKWYFDRSESPIFPFLVFSSHPLPFVASTGNSNLFWITFLISTFVDGILVLFFLVAGKITFVMIAVIRFILTVGNMAGFLKCYNIAKISAEKVRRSLLLDQNVTFQAANEGNVSDGGSDKEKKDEQNYKELSDEIE